MGPRAGLDRCEKFLPHRDSIPDRPARSQSLYRLSYPAHDSQCAMVTFTPAAVGVAETSTAE